MFRRRCVVLSLLIFIIFIVTLFWIRRIDVHVFYSWESKVGVLGLMNCSFFINIIRCLDLRINIVAPWWPPDWANDVSRVQFINRNLSIEFLQSHRNSKCNLPQIFNFFLSLHMFIWNLFKRTILHKACECWKLLFSFSLRRCHMIKIQSSSDLIVFFLLSFMFNWGWRA